ncbi:MAG: DUF4259 domain-containing protein [Pseudomonadota bacterium]
MIRKFVFTAIAIALTTSALAGAWGAGIFENDDALDYVDLFLEDPKQGYDFMAMSMLDIAYNDGYVGAQEAAFGLASAEVIAAVNGKPSEALPAGIAAWAKGKNKPDALTLERARGVLDRVLNKKNSELAQLYADDADLDAEWRATIADLRTRLK